MAGGKLFDGETKGSVGRRRDRVALSAIEAHGDRYRVRTDALAKADSTRTGNRKNGAIRKIRVMHVMHVMHRHELQAGGENPIASDL